MARVTVDSGAVGVVVPAALAALLLEVGPIDATRLPGIGSYAAIVRA